MPRKKAKKSAQIRQLLEANPKMLVKDIVSTLASKGVRVQSSTVYFLRAKMRRKARKQRVRQVVGTNGAVNAVDLIVKVRNLAGEAGGYDRLRQLVDILSSH